MHNNFETLQKKCQRYRFKQFIKKAFPLLLVSTALLIGSYLYLDQQNCSIEDRPQHITKEITPPALVKQQQNIPEPIKKAKERETKPLQKPQQAAYKDITYNLHVDDSYIPQHTKVKQKPKKEQIANKKKIVAPQKQVIANTPIPKVTPLEEEIKKNKPLSMSVKKIDSIDAMQTLYEKEQTYTLALKIAQAYYDTNRYSQTSLWAKKANILERENDGAWILYAKSEYAKGHKKRAIEILKLYLANANSSEGDSLLLTWTQGK